METRNQVIRRRIQAGGRNDWAIAAILALRNWNEGRIEVGSYVCVPWNGEPVKRPEIWKVTAHGRVNLIGRRIYKTREPGREVGFVSLVWAREDRSAGASNGRV